MKSYTSVEQSRKLAEILPPESADMFYDGVQDLYKEKTYNIPINGSSITVRTGHIITQKGIKANLLLPCWSLAALFSMLPKSAYLEKGSSTELCRVTLPVELISSDWNLEAVDACVAMIEKLHEQKLL